MSYSTSERLVASVLSRFPFIKKWLKVVYQSLNYLAYKKKYNYKTNLAIQRVGRSDKETFFGYYDKSPINPTGKYIIFQETTHSTKKKPNKQYPIYIILFDIEKDIEIKRWETYAYNWQQGSKLMWIDNERFIFNSYNNQSKTYEAIVININELETKKTIASPIYDANNNKALSLSFERLNEIMPDYGYRNHKNHPKFAHDFDYSKEGVFAIDLENNTKQLIVSVDSVIKLHHQSNMDQAKHWFNHIMLSPESDKFIFLHRWINSGKKFDALMVSDIDGQNLKCLSDYEMVSHCFWKSNTEVVAYLRAQEGDKYYQIDTTSGTISIIDNKELNSIGDGHPNTYKDLMLYDCYPNRSRLKELNLYNFADNSSKNLGVFLESLSFKEETRCDLHPKWDYQGKYIFIDSVHEGQRGLYMLDYTKL